MGLFGQQIISNNGLPVTQGGTWNVRVQDGSGTPITSTGGALDINCKTGCSGAGVPDTVVTGTLGSPGATLSLPVAGLQSASVVFPSGNNLVATVVAEATSDGSLWQTTYMRFAGTSNENWSNAAFTLFPSTEQLNILVPGGSSNVRVRLATYTSGSATVTMRAAFQAEAMPLNSAVNATPNTGIVTPIGGVRGSTVQVFLSNLNGQSLVDLQAWADVTLGAPSNYGTSPGAVTVPGVNAFVTNTPTVQPGNTPNTTPWLMTISQGGNSAVVSATNALKVDGSSVIQPVNHVQTAGTALGVITTYGTSPGAVNVESVNAFVTNTPNVSVTNTPTVNQGTNPWTDQGALADNGVAAATNRVGTVDAIAQTDYHAGTALTQGRNAALTVGTDGLLWTAQLPAMRPASYTASAEIAGTSTTDVSCIPGNATNTVLVTGLTIDATQGTAAQHRIEVIKRSAADTGGTPANMTRVPDDSNYAGASTIPVTYTGTGPTPGAAVGDILNLQQTFLTAATTTAAEPPFFKDWSKKPIILRGVAQEVCINLGGALTTGLIDITWTWIETATITP
jgi:hypothetical protein